MEVGSDQSMSRSDDSTYTVHDDSTYTVHDDSMYTVPDESMYTVHACHERAGVFAELLVIRVQMNLLQGSNGCIGLVFAYLLSGTLASLICWQKQVLQFLSSLGHNACSECFGCILSAACRHS